ncbi:methylmalonyl Co-A mutase-associated GTPase MeaB [Futiania mangrovi]|uniref:Methylmalonyl Co-A mutase-associated GTPase MeaB n=1 Tax=Futiania mangrovi TaxID=2959716 RepID=A0A9J6PCY4_9PROT|nr:methylmalonyl Co-A mutase-associated GTPase MeaB [Futiania mangrovii]MCP1336166.1 methylmalonyl Co-A mutase-associated GTPase MeaB [Futiania mangrovii]
MSDLDEKALADGVLAGDRRALARAITLVESTRADHRRAAEALLARVLPQTGRAVRLGLSGPPGAGKSTFIEALGGMLIAQGKRIAVLAVDPSSARSGGSILGDKTRMETLARDPAAFVRPSPSAGQLGGVARRTREAMLLVEAAGFDVVIVETVGVGQSETTVADMTDMFLLLLSPGGGDELQGIKRGIMELADLVIVNKADGDLEAAAKRSEADYAAALRMLRPRTAEWTPRAMRVSSLKGTGLEDVWAAVEAHRDAIASGGGLAALRAAQAKSWLWAEIREGLMERFQAHESVAAALPAAERAVAGARGLPAEEARRLLDLFAGESGGETDRTS